MTFPLVVLQSVDDRVFHNRLKQERKDHILTDVYILRDIHLIVDPVFKPQLLDLDIIFHMGDLRAQRRERGSRIFQHIAHGFAEQLDRGRDLPVPRRKRLHTDRLQRIVQKVRIDLARKHLKLHALLLDHQLLLVDLGAVDLRLLLLDILHHHLKIAERLCQFIVSLKGGDQLVVLVACLVHLLTQHVDTPRKIVREEIDDKPRDQHGKHKDRHADALDVMDAPITLVVDRRDIQPGFRLIRMQSGNADKALLSVHILFSQILIIRLFMVDLQRELLPVTVPVRAVKNTAVLHRHHRLVLAGVDPCAQIIVARLDHHHRMIPRAYQWDLPHQTKVPVDVAVLILPAHLRPEDRRLAGRLLIPVLLPDLRRDPHELLIILHVGVVRVDQDLLKLRIIILVAVQHAHGIDRVIIPASLAVTAGENLLDIVVKRDLLRDVIDLCRDLIQDIAHSLVVGLQQITVIIYQDPVGVSHQKKTNQQDRHYDSHEIDRVQLLPYTRLVEKAFFPLAPPLPFVPMHFLLCFLGIIHKSRTVFLLLS